MRGLPSIVLVGSLIMLGGCASTSTTGVCAHASERDLSPELGWPSFRDKSLLTKNTKVTLHAELRAVASRFAAQDGAPEPRFTSAEWWVRENVRLSKAMIICRGCLALTAGDVSQLAPAIGSLQASTPKVLLNR